MTRSGTPEHEPETPDKDAEIARLRQQLDSLQQADEPPGPPRSRMGWWRPVVATLLVVVAAIIAPVSVLASWARDEVGDTDRYVDTVAPLASDPAVQDAVVARIESVVFENLQLEQVTRQLVDALGSRDLPPQVVVTLNAAAGPLASGIEGFVSDRIRAFVESDAFEQAWVEANRTAHEQLVAVLTGEGSDSVDVSNGTVSIQIATLVDAVKQELIDRGFGIAERIPEVDASFTILQSADIEKAQGLFDLLDGLATWLPVVGLLCLAVAIIVSRDRRRTVLAAGIAIAAAMILLGAVLNIARPLYLDALPAGSSTEAAGVIYDQVVSFIRLALRGVLVVALTVAVVAWLAARTGPGATARRGIVRGVDALRGGTARAGLRTGSFGTALGRYKSAIRVAIIGLSALLYIMQDHPTGATALTFVVVTVLLLIVLEILATEPAATQPEVQPAGKT